MNKEQLVAFLFYIDRRIAEFINTKEADLSFDEMKYGMEAAAEARDDLIIALGLKEEA